MSTGILMALLLLGPQAQPIPHYSSTSFQGFVVTQGPASQIFDLSSQGKLSKPRTVKYQSSSVFGFICLVEAPQGGAWYGVSGAFSGTDYPQHLFTVGSSGLAGLAGMLNTPFAEGDCAFDPTTQKLWVVQAGGELYTIDVTSPFKTSLVATLPGASDISAMAFDKTGQLYCLDLGGGGKLLKVSPAGVVLSTISLSSAAKIGNGNAAMAIDSTGTVYVILPVFNGSLVVQTLYRIDLVGSGELTKLGETGQTGITGMIVKGSRIQRRVN